MAAHRTCNLKAPDRADDEPKDWGDFIDNRKLRSISLSRRAQLPGLNVVVGEGCAAAKKGAGGVRWCASMHLRWKILRDDGNFPIV